MNKLFIQYPKCTTCKKAKKFLIENSIEFVDRNIVEENPTEVELKEWIKLSGLEPKKFFNTSGKMYKELNLKEKIKEMTEDEIISLLASNGMLVKRPLLVSDKKVIVGFKEDSYRDNLI